MKRDVLPATRRCVTRRVRITDPRTGRGATVHFAVGLYPDGRPGELFVDVAKQGQALRDWAAGAAMMLSIALQHGTPLWTCLALHVGSRGEPAGTVAGHERITRCTSVMDLIARSLAIDYLGRDDLADLPPEAKP